MRWCSSWARTPARPPGRGRGCVRRAARGAQQDRYAVGPAQFARPGAGAAGAPAPHGRRGAGRAAGPGGGRVRAQGPGGQDQLRRRPAGGQRPAAAGSGAGHGHHGAAPVHTAGRGGRWRDGPAQRGPARDQHPPPRPGRPDAGAAQPARQERVGDRCHARAHRAGAAGVRGLHGPHPGRARRAPEDAARAVPPARPPRAEGAAGAADRGARILGAQAGRAQGVWRDLCERARRHGGGPGHGRRDPGHAGRHLPPAQHGVRCRCRLRRNWAPTCGR